MASEIGTTTHAKGVEAHQFTPRISENDDLYVTVTIGSSAISFGPFGDVHGGLEDQAHELKRIAERLNAIAIDTLEDIATGVMA